MTTRPIKVTKPCKFIHTEATDTALRQAYRLYREYNNRNAIGNLAAKLGWPKWVLTHRAREIDLARIKERPWTEAEEELLEKIGYLSDKVISVRFKAAGYRRSATAIHLKIKRLQIKRTLDGYSARQLAVAFGVDDHKVTGWIKRGLLKAVGRGTARTQEQGGDTFFIHRDNVRRFILSCPDEVDLGRCDKYWLLALISKDQLCAEFLKEVA
jgi:hypothetical protein